jgi:hypothetical protein
MKVRRKGIKVEKKEKGNKEMKKEGRIEGNNAAQEVRKKGETFLG